MTRPRALSTVDASRMRWRSGDEAPATAHLILGDWGCRVARTLLAAVGASSVTKRPATKTPQPKAAGVATPRATSKQATVIALLSQRKGATIIQAFRQQRRLLAIRPLNETLHHLTRRFSKGIIASIGFSHSLGHERPKTHHRRCPLRTDADLERFMAAGQFRQTPVLRWLLRAFSVGLEAQQWRDWGDAVEPGATKHSSTPQEAAPILSSPRGLSDLAVVCANCHRMIHRGGQSRPLDGLIPQ
jgi:hypothetical protein